MSTRKTTAAAATKVENAATATATTTTSTIISTVTPMTTATTTTITTATGSNINVNAEVGEKVEMGANASVSAPVGTTTTEHNSNNDTEVVASTITTGKDKMENNAKQLSNEPKRITRNSPLLASPTTSGGSKKELQQRSSNVECVDESESEDGGGSVSSTAGVSAKRHSLIRGRKSLKEAKEATTIAKIDAKDTAENACEKKGTVVEQLVIGNSREPDEKDTKEIKDVKEVKEKETKDSKEIKEASEIITTLINNTTGTLTTATTTTTSTVSAAATNRLTRKAAHELIPNTRITRNRQTPGAVNNRPETPPVVAITGTRGRRGAAMKRGQIEGTGKRKRSVEEPISVSSHRASSLEPGPKYIKIEVKDETETVDDELRPPSSASLGGSDVLEQIKIKQELVESDESATDSSVNAALTTTSGGIATAVARGRRWSARKSQQSVAPIVPISPSTRATRHNKVSSPSPTPAPLASACSSMEPKRRRMGSVPGGGSTITRSSSLSLLKNINSGGILGTTAATATHAPDEDSKDSMASSMDEVLVEIKSDKMNSEHEETDCEMDEKSIIIEKSLTTNTNGLVGPLTVNTDVTILHAEIEDGKPITEASSSVAGEVATKNNDLEAVDGGDGGVGNSSGSEKAASLSPEMVSEGVSEISVKQFYKKPKFLENNLGIEEDPKLGEIVQKVSTVKDVSNQNSIEQKKVLSEKAVEDDKHKQKEKSLDEQNANNSLEKTDANDDSASTNNFSPLIVEDEEEDEVVVQNVPVEQKANNTDHAAEEENKDRIDEQEINKDTGKVNNEDVDDEDDGTIEENDAMSMDNNASLHEDAPEERDDELEEETEVLLEQHIELKIPEMKKEKTKKETCDREEQVKLETKENSLDRAETEEKLKVETDSGSDKKETLMCKEEKAVKVRISIENVNKDETVDKKEIENKTVSILDDDADVLAKIEAELKKIREKQKNDLGQEISTTQEEEENKENLLTTETETSQLPEEVKLIENVLESGHIEEEEEQLVLHDDDEDDDDEDEEEEDGVLVIDHDRDDELMDVDQIAQDENKVELNEKALSENSAEENIENPLQKMECEKDEEDSTSHKSEQSNTDTNSWATFEMDNENEETLRQKEKHLQNLGLLTHKAAEKRRQDIQQAAETKSVTQQQHLPSSNAKRNGKLSSSVATPAAAHEYTGTLKTVIKLNRNGSGGNSSSSSKKNAGATAGAHLGKEHASGSSGSGAGSMRRQSLKMTFQKGRGRHQGAHADRAADQQTHGEDAYYTIQNENEGAQKSNNSAITTSSSTAAATTTIANASIGMLEHSNVVAHTHGRKIYSRSNINSHNNNSNTTTTTNTNSSHSESNDAFATISSASVHINTKKDEKEEILIPEKASSFKFHPGRLCEDQCFYCSGKFGLYDTPCHVGQIKSLERQQKILANEEKLTVDNCLCDACFRHVDRRANVPSYKKRISASGNSEGASTSAAAAAMTVNASNSSAGTGGDGLEDEDTVQRKCLVPECPNPAGHSLRRKCIRKSVKKFLLNFELPTGSPYVWLCQSHYSAVVQCSGCVLCKRRLGKNHMYHITSDTDRLEKALSEMGIPVQLGIGTAVCKLCRYFANLLMKPPDSTKSQKAEFVKNYRKRLLQFHNIHDGSNEVSEMDEEDSNGASVTTTNTSQKKKQLSPNSSNKRDTNTPIKDLPSPNGSSGSSVECLGEAATANAVSASMALGGINTEQQQQMLLANDVFVGYDVPMLPTDSNSSSSPASPASGSNNSKQMSKLKAILQSSTNNNNTSVGSAIDAETTKADISNVLRANPNISMRELFPGEEDLGLHFKAPFGSSNSQRTPEGWTRVQTFLQYDEPTRRLWEELQKPYGNQSSFLRHLILLEKYFRNGDLVLTPNASSNASVYTRTVRQRLTSYDQGHCGAVVNAKQSNAEATRDKVSVPTVEINDVDDDEDKDKGASTSKEHQHKIALAGIGMGKNANNLSMQLRSRSVSVDKLTKQFSSNAVTIIPRPKDQSGTTLSTVTTNSAQKSLLKEKDNSHTNAINLSANTSSVTNSSSNNNNPSSNSRSILKTNLLGMNNKSVEILPLSSSNSGSGSGSGNGNSSNSNAIKMAVIAGNTITATESKQQKILESANKLLANTQSKLSGSNNTIVNTVGGASGGSSSLLTSPPELVSLQRRSTGGNTTITATVPVAVTSNTSASLLANKRAPLPSGSAGGGGGGKSHTQRVPPNVVILPDTLTPQERLQSKSWRPTLMPVEENQHLMNKGGPLYQTADGRRLPALVQVQSGGKPFLISIFDYNRMCILRREKLLRDRMLQNNNKGRHDAKQQHQQQQQQPQQQHHQHQQHQHQQQQQQQQQQHQQVQKQHINANSNVTNMSGGGYKQLSKQQQVAQQQLLQLQLLQFQKQQQQQAVKAATAVRYQPIAPKPSTSMATAVPTTNTTAAISNVAAGAFTAPMNTLLANVITSAAAAAAANANAAAGAGNALNSAPWLWNNYPDANQLLLNGVAPLSHTANSTVVTNAAIANNNKLPQLLPKPVPASSSNSIVSGGGTLPPTITSKHQQQLLLDNTLISKIPKSLTVIPQHKLMAHNVGGGNNNSSAAGGSGFKE